MAISIRESTVNNTIWPASNTAFGSSSSIEPISLENRFKILPPGLVSKLVCIYDTSVHGIMQILRAQHR